MRKPPDRHALPSPTRIAWAAGQPQPSTEHCSGVSWNAPSHPGIAMTCVRRAPLCYDRKTPNDHGWAVALRHPREFLRDRGQRSRRAAAVVLHGPLVVRSRRHHPDPRLSTTLAHYDLSIWRDGARRTQVIAMPGCEARSTKPRSSARSMAAAGRLPTRSGLARAMRGDRAASIALEGEVNGRPLNYHHVVIIRDGCAKRGRCERGQTPLSRPIV